MSFLKGLRGIGQSATQQKARKATDSDVRAGATGTLMNELSVLTYSAKTMQEICEVIRKRLSNGNSRLKNGHDSVIRVLKTLTLIDYLMCNGSEEFVEWMQTNLFYIEGLRHFSASQDADLSRVKQVRTLSQDIATMLRDSALLDKKRNDIIEFRSSVSTPGRKSTDTSHIQTSGRSSLTRSEIITDNSSATKSLQSRSLDFPRKSSKYSQDRRRILTTLAEEETDMESLRLPTSKA